SSKPVLQKSSQLPWWPQPKICRSLVPLVAYQHTQAVDCNFIHGGKGCLIRPIVAQIRNPPFHIGLAQDRLHSASLVAPYAQFHASLELQQFQPVGPRQGIEECPRPLLDEPCLARRNVTPMHYRAVRLVLEESAETVAFEQRTQHVQFLAGGCRRLLQLTSTIGEKALRSVQ